MEIENKIFHIVPYKVDIEDKYSQKYNSVILNISDDKTIQFSIKEINEEILRIRNQKDKKPEQLKIEEANIRNQFAGLQWIASVSSKINDNPDAFSIIEALSEGYIEDFKERNFPKMLIGGGFVYVAAKFSETSKYKNVRFKGLFYQAFSKPNIVRME